MPKSIAPASAQWRAYVKVFCCLSGTLVTAVTGLNYVIDPYLTHQWDTPLVQRLRPTRERLSAWGKTYAVARYQPMVLYLGNSRTELGLPTELSTFKGKTVFNGALSGASLGDMIAMAQHARNVSRLDTVVWGLDAPSFSLPAGNSEFDRALVADGGDYFFKRSLLNLKRGLTFDMTFDSISILRGTFGTVCRSSLAFYGQRDLACATSVFAKRGGTKMEIVPLLQQFIRDDGPSTQALDALDVSLAQLCSGGTRVRLYINPTHALMVDALYWAEKYSAMEAWQGALSSLTERHRHGGCDIRLYDFSGFNSITSEPIPQFGQRSDMAYFWETSHYRVNVGRMILARIFGDGGQVVPSDFGVELLPSDLAVHLAQMRARRDLYHVEHAGETVIAKRIAHAELARMHARKP